MTPRVEALARSVGEVVHAAHEDGLDAVRGTPGAKELGEEDWHAILEYCAKEKCVAAGATCPGCQRRTAAQGLNTLDDYLKSHAEIVLRDSGSTIHGPGAQRAEFESHAELTRAWAGEPYWFWARRVLRKLRYGIRKAGTLGTIADMESGERMLAPSVLLMEPQIPDNIGMVARAMGNFGLYDLRVIKPRDGWPSEKARAVASGAAAVIDEARLEPTLTDACVDLHWVAATTARQRDMRKPVMTPAQAAAEMRGRIDAGQRCGILFGRERNGLESAEVADCDAIVMIPVHPSFASLNLAQAVLLLGYEWLKLGSQSSLGRVTTYEQPVTTGVNLGRTAPATKQELIGFFEHLEAELESRGFFYPPERRATVVRNLRTMFTRMQGTEQEIRTLRGIVATLAKGRRQAQDGDAGAS